MCLFPSLSSLLAPVWLYIRASLLLVLLNDLVFFTVALRVKVLVLNVTLSYKGSLFPNELVLLSFVIAFAGENTSILVVAAFFHLR